MSNFKMPFYEKPLTYTCYVEDNIFSSDDIDDTGEIYLHQVDGPAIEWDDGYNEYWINNVQLPTEEVEAWLKENQVALATEGGQLAFILRWS